MAREEQRGVGAPVAASTVGVLATLHAGVRYHQSGNLARAEVLYGQVLARAPDNAEALHLLGVIRSEQRRYAEAIELIGRALERMPRSAPAHNNLANALAAVGRGEEAAASYRTALALWPEFTEAHNNLGNALNALGRHEEAAASLRQALALRPGYAEAHHNLGNALRGLHQLDEAVASYQRAVTLNPRYPEAHNALGTALGALGRHEEALASLQRALALKPDYAEACLNQGSEFTALKRYEEALVSHRQALAIRPGYAEAHNNLGTALHGLNRYEEALESYLRALALRPSYAQARLNLGTTLNELGRHDEALASHREAVALQPDYAQAHNSIGFTLCALGRPDEAMESLREAVALRPDYAEARWNRALVRLLLGDLPGGWGDYECRIAARVGTDYLADPRAPQRILPRPSTLLPLNFSGKRILLLPDQGLGDELFFLRFASLSRARGAWLAYLCSPKIASMVERSGAVDRVVETAAQAGEIDHVFSVGDLPLILGTSPGEPLPSPLPLTPLPERLAAARARLHALGRGPYLAVTWRAGTPPSEQQHVQRRLLFKEAAIEPFAAALAGWRGEIVALQRQPRPGEVQRLSELLRRPVHDASELNEDLEAMLGLLATVDDYVAVSNTNVHLMAGLNRGGRVIVPNPPEWRWLHAGATSPWFPGFHLYRQAPGQTMEQALATLAAHLRAHRAAESTSG